MKSMLGIGLVCGLAWSMHAQAASFNCDKAKTTTEHAICEYRQINDADVKMATTYTILKKAKKLAIAIEKRIAHSNSLIILYKT